MCERRLELPLAVATWQCSAMPNQEAADVPSDWVPPPLDSNVSVLDAFRTAAEKVREADRSLGKKYFSLNFFPPWSPTRKFCRWSPPFPFPTEECGPAARLLRQ